MEERNKLWRTAKSNDKFLRRLKAMGLANAPEKYYCFKQQGKPCSCYGCSTRNYEVSDYDKFKHGKNRKENKIKIECYE